MPSALGGVLGIVAEVQQRIVVFARDQNHVTAATAIAAAGPPARNKFFPSKREAAIAAVAGFDRNDYFIDEHNGTPSMSEGTLVLRGDDVDELT